MAAVETPSLGDHKQDKGTGVGGGGQGQGDTDKAFKPLGRQPDSIWGRIPAASPQHAGYIWTMAVFHSIFWKTKLSLGDIPWY